MSRSGEDEMLEALGADEAPEADRQYTRQEERLIAGFEDIQRFVETHGHAPRYGEDRDIFERLYAVRLDRLRELTDARELLSPMDPDGLLSASAQAQSNTNLEEMNEDALLDELDVGGNDDISVLRHVQPHERKKLTEEIAAREPCKDFDRFQSLFADAEEDLRSGQRETIRFGRDTSILEGYFFILAGQMAYVAEVGDPIKASNGERDARLRVIFSNGTESDLLQRSLQRALYKDETGRRLTDPDTGPLFSDTMDADETQSGTIYVLRSRSDQPFVAEHRELVHKIGVTGGKVETRIANAENDATYLLAGVDVVATWKLSGINRTKLEKLLHRVFASANLELTIEDRFGKSVQPREWFLVPLHVLDEAVGRIRDGSIVDMAYDPATASLIEREAG